jgi:hypothetical protein
VKVCRKHTIGSEIFLDAPDVTQVCWVVSNPVSVHLETMLVSVQGRCTVYAKHTIALGIILEHTRWYSIVTRLKWKLILVYLEIVLIMTQDR